MTSKQKEKIIVPDEIVMDKIYYIREQKVMLDHDLAELYGVETKRLKEAVRRNKARFPADFMFQMNKKELENWKAKIESSSHGRGGIRYSPFCFTEQGVTMLSCILNSERAISVNIRIVRIFSRMREMMLTHKDILLKLEQLEKNTSRHDAEIKKIFEYLKGLLNPPKVARTLIGFNRKEENENSPKT